MSTKGTFAKATQTQLYYVVVGVADVNGGSEGLGAVAHLEITNFDTVGLQPGGQIFLGDGFDLQTEVVDIVLGAGRRRAACTTQFAVCVDDVDQGFPGP